MKKIDFKSLNTNIIIVIFALCFFAPQITFIFVKDYVKVDTSENRNLAKKPDFKISEIEKYSDNYEKYYNDNLPYRGIIKKIWTNSNYYLFNDTVNQNVILGKEGWIFYTKESDGNPVKDAQGISQFTNETQNKIYETINKNTILADEKNIKLYYLICPNKECIYKEYLPNNIEIYDNATRTDKLVKSLNDKNVKNVIYPKNELLNEKSNHEVYYKCDTHWNDVGAFVGFENCMKKIEKNFNDFNYNVTYSGEKVVSRDLNGLSGIKGILTDNEPYLLYKENIKVKSKTQNNITIFENEDYKINKTVMIVGDSFAKDTKLKNYFSKIYKRVIVLHRSNYKTSLVDEYNPDILICEFVERYDGELKKFKLF